MAAKYSRPEVERRWLIPDGLPAAATHASFRLIEDRYLKGTTLRLRAVREQGTEPIYKLGKKYHSGTEGWQDVVSVYLTEDEFAVVASLPALIARKRRFAIAGGSVDEYIEPRPGFLIFEAEFGSTEDARKFVPPEFVGLEVTGKGEYSGFALASPG
jgi:CYTH domain-containing protein